MPTITLFHTVETITKLRISDEKLRAIFKLPKRKGSVARVWFNNENHSLEIDFVKHTFSTIKL